MILADALCYAADFKPQAVIDLATLTGACVIALGENVAAGFFCNDDELSRQIKIASNNTNEKLWRLPLYEEYRDKIRSDNADIKNTGGRFGGVGTSSVFLEEFTSYPWAHWDIAGMATDTMGYTPSDAACQIALRHSRRHRLWRARPGGIGAALEGMTINQ